MAQTITRNEFLILLDNLLELAPGTLIGGEMLVDQGWDSLRLMEFISLADSKLGLPVSPAVLIECKTVNDLIALVGGRIVP